MANDPIRRLTIELIKQHPDAPARTLARRLVHETNNALTLEQARNRVRHQLGQCGVRSRKAPQCKRAARKPGEVPKMPRSQADPWTPHDLGVTGTVGILSDIHVPYHSEVALAAAVDYLKTIGIDCLLLNGDVADFYTISRWQKDPKKRDFRGELDAVIGTLAWLRDQFPDASIVYKVGNHEERWQHWLWQHAAEISDHPRMRLSEWLEFDELGIELVDEQRPVMVGKLPVMHGHELPKGLTNPVNMARGAFLRTLHTVLVGHGHRTSGHAESSMWHDEVFCWSQGCLCDLTPEYARINRWNHGFAVVTVDKDGTFDVDNLRISKQGKVRSS